jgi:hypothetical protein
MPTVINLGDFVYLDSFAGLIPAKVLAFGPLGQHARCRVTATRGDYKRGEVVTFAHNAVVPRNHVYRRSGQYLIRGYWTFARTQGE